MEEEPPQKLLGGEGHQPLLAVVGVIFPAKGDVAIGNVDDPVIRDSDAMRVAGQIVEDVLGASEWPFGVDHPVVTKQCPQKAIECFLVGQWFHAARKPQLLLLESAFQTGNELTAKNAAEHFHRQEERVARVNPALMVGREAAGWDHAMNVRMNLQILPPGMQHTEEADLSAEMLRIGSNLQECGGTGVEQDVIDDSLVLQSEPR